MMHNFIIIKNYFKLVKGKTCYILQLFISSILGHSASLLLPVISSNIILHITNNSINKAYTEALLLGICYIGYNLIWYWNYVSYSYNFKVCYRNLRDKTINKIFTYDEKFTTKISKSTIINTNNKDVCDLSMLIDSICEYCIEMVKIIVIIIIFLKTNLYIGLIALFINIIYIISVNNCNIKSTKHLASQRKYADKITETLSQVLNGFREIKQFNIENKIKKRFNPLYNKWEDEYMLKRKYINTRYTILPLIVDLGKFALYIFLIFLFSKGKIQINILILLITYFEYLIVESNNLMTCSNILNEYNISINRINNIINYSPNKPIEYGINDNDYINGVVEFKDVSFSYQNLPTINNISFIAKPNEITAIVGHSGSGKSTIANLLLRLYKINQGTILIDKENIYSYTKQVYANNVIAVNQAPFIFNMSIKDNLSLINSNKKLQIEACKRVGIHEYIMSLPRGYNTILKENASDFSGGQKQLLALARTLLSKAEILIFDEITSSLDINLTNTIKNVLTDLKQDHTIILITHKKDIMQIADRVIILNKGFIVGNGSNQELINNKHYIELLQCNHYSTSNNNI